MSTFTLLLGRVNFEGNLSRTQRKPRGEERNMTGS
jgi:hypothetical protein